MSIVWVASYPRSGNTWTRIFLNNLFDLIEGREPGEPKSLAGLVPHEVGKPHWLPFIDKPLPEYTREEIAALRSKVQERLAGEAGTKVFLKTHNALIKSYGHSPINMGVTWGAIYIVRNPLDITPSFASHFGVDIDEAIRIMGLPCYETPNLDNAVYEIYGAWSENIITWTATPATGLFITRYEDLVADPAKEFGKMVKFLRVDADEDQIKKAIELASFDRLADYERNKGFAEARPNVHFFRSGKVGAWKDSLTAAQIDAVKATHRSTMEVFGYV